MTQTKRSRISLTMMLMVALLSTALPATGATGPKRYVIRISLPSTIKVVSPAMEMQQKAARWETFGRVVHCPKQCADSRIKDDVILPALEGPRTKTGATYVLYFTGLNRGQYRFIVTAYDAASKVKRYASKQYTLGSSDRRTGLQPPNGVVVRMQECPDHSGRGTLSVVGGRVQRVSATA